MAHYGQAKAATRSSTCKAYIAYIYGDAVLLQQDLCCSENDGDGQILAAKLARQCKMLLNADMLEVESLMDRIIDESINEVKKYFA